MEQMTIDIFRETLLIIIKISMPMLLAALIIGLVVSIFQAVTSIQEQTLAFVPKIMGVFLAVICFSSWMMNTMTAFITRVFSSFQRFL